MSENDRRKPEDDEDESLDDLHASKDDAEASEGDADASKYDSDESEDDADASEDDDEPVEGDDPEAPPLDPAVVKRFLGSKQARDVAIAAIRRLVPKQEAEDLATDAIVRAMRAKPPRLEAVLVSWLTTIADRRAIRWLEKRKRRQKYEGAMPTKAAREDPYTGHALEDDGAGEAARAGYSPDEDDEPGEMVGDHLVRLIGGNAKELEVLGWIRERAEGKTFKQIAAERGLTEAQIANRIYRLKLKYQKPVERRRQRMMILWLLGGAVAVAVALAALLYWLLHREVRSYYKPPPAPSASSTTPSFPEGPPVSHPAPDDEERDAGDR
jgi:DNA-directed RNA polymerase specialized sigma24 family protein